MRPIYINGEKLLYFNELPKESIPNAISCILLDEKRYIEKKIIEYKAKTLNDKINNKQIFFG